MLIRSLLSVPGNRPAMLDKALQSGSDAISPDLQDSVPAAMRAEARETVAHWIAAGRKPAIIVRTSAVSTEDFLKDVDAVVRPGLTGLRIPDVNSPEDVINADRAIGAAERKRGLAPNSIALIPIAESARGIYQLYDILTASPRVIGTAFPGGRDGDLARDLGVTWTLQGDEFFYARSKVLFDARAAGVALVFDSVFTDLQDMAGFERDTRRGRQFGYTGRLAIHPNQIAIINRVHVPTPEQIADAQELLLAFREAEAGGRAAISYRGRMIDIAMRKTAEAILRQTNPDPQKAS
jgi:citrate lyase subunit beta / citryl-CoA lyase